MTPNLYVMNGKIAVIMISIVNPAPATIFFCIFVKDFGMYQIPRGTNGIPLILPNSK